MDSSRNQKNRFVWLTPEAARYYRAQLRTAVRAGVIALEEQAGAEEAVDKIVAKLSVAQEMDACSNEEILATHHLVAKLLRLDLHLRITSAMEEGNIDRARALLEREQSSFESSGACKLSESSLRATQDALAKEEHRARARRSLAVAVSKMEEEELNKAIAQGESAGLNPEELQLSPKVAKTVGKLFGRPKLAPNGFLVLHDTRRRRTDLKAALATAKVALRTGCGTDDALRELAPALMLAEEVDLGLDDDVHCARHTAAALTRVTQKASLQDAMARSDADALQSLVEGGAAGLDDEELEMAKAQIRVLTGQIDLTAASEAPAARELVVVEDMDVATQASWLPTSPHAESAEPEISSDVEDLALQDRLLELDGLCDADNEDMVLERSVSGLEKGPELDSLIPGEVPYESELDPPECLTEYVEQSCVLSGFNSDVLPDPQASFANVADVWDYSTIKHRKKPIEIMTQALRYR